LRGPRVSRAAESKPRASRRPPSPLVLGSSSPTSQPPRPNGLCGRSRRACGGLPSHRVSSCRSTAGGHWCPVSSREKQNARTRKPQKGLLGDGTQQRMTC
jgi:hypothetical protein